ncbi:MAG: DUF302 domain-containing protein [Salaquimonas sp.]|jgi:uncharacterized protein (DUF302 family)|nr:DUF302 domain-containing protein [Salaquimonas sp.]
MKRILPTVSTLAALAFIALPFCPARAADDVTTYQTQGDFEDVAAEIEDAIVNKGLVVDYHGFIGDMLARTASDVGSDKKLYENAEFFQFCSAALSRKVMETDIANIAYCPYVVFVYEATPGNITVGFRRLPAGDGRDEVNTLLDGIAKAAVANQ